ncbi:MAG: hypothetical protein ACYCPS_02175 [Candidatus Saccharimonadales bacterium]
MKFKQNDIVSIVVAIVAGIIVAFVADKYVFSNAGSKNTQVDVVPAIKTYFPKPPSQYFNSQAVDPTQIINIGPNNSQQPFNSGQ